MRVFIGIDLSQELIEKVLSVQKQLEKTGARIKFTEPENLHFNLKFMGETPENKVDDIKRALNDISRRYKPFNLRVSGIGVFPSLDYIKVLWIGVTSGSRELISLAEAMDSALSERGFERSARKFVPHLTLGRVRNKEKKKELISAIKSLEKTDIGNMLVQEISLMQSMLGKYGPTYKKLHTVKLKASPSPDQ